MGAAVIISSLAALNGWTLLLGQVPLAAARDGAFPRVFGRTNSHGAPARGSGRLASLSSVLLVAQGVGGQRGRRRLRVHGPAQHHRQHGALHVLRLAEAMLVSSVVDHGGGWRIGPFTTAALVAFAFSVWVVLRVRRDRGDVDADPHVPRPADLRRAGAAPALKAAGDNPMSATHSSLRVPMRALMVRPDRGAGTATGRAFAAR